MPRRQPLPLENLAHRIGAIRRQVEGAIVAARRDEAGRGVADDGNPRGLAFQLAAMRALLSEIAGAGDTSLAAAAAALQDEPQAMVRAVVEAADQSVAALFLPELLRSLRDAVADLSDRVSRRYFALLPSVRTVGIEVPTRSIRGAA